MNVVKNKLYKKYVSLKTDYKNDTIAISDIGFIGEIENKYPEFRSLYKGKTTRGLTIIELLVIMLVITVIASISIPSLIRARLEADNANTASELRTIYTSVVMYQCDKNENPKSWNDLETYINVPRFQDKYLINPN